MKLFLFLTFILSIAHATTFVEIPLKNLIKASNAQVFGEVLSSRVDYNEENEITTFTLIKVTKSLGLENEDFIEVRTPGGVIGDYGSIVQGSPKFKEGEKVFLFLNKEDEKISSMGLALGTYREKLLGKERVYVNDVFPEKPEFGQMTSDSFIKIIEESKEASFVTKLKDKYELENEKIAKENHKKRERSISSTKESKEEVLPTKKIEPLWFLILLGALGFVFKKREKKY